MVTLNNIWENGVDLTVFENHVASYKSHFSVWVSPHFIRIKTTSENNTQTGGVWDSQLPVQAYTIANYDKSSDQNLTGLEKIQSLKPYMAATQ